MENAVYIHCAGWGIKYMLVRCIRLEIDFVEKADSMAYVQVTYLPASEETVEREFSTF